MLTTHDAAAHDALKVPGVCLQHLCGLFVEGVVWVGILRTRACETQLISENLGCSKIVTAMPVRTGKLHACPGSVVPYQEQKLEPVDDGADAQHWLPVFPQDVETDVAFQVNVRVVDLQ